MAKKAAAPAKELEPEEVSQEDPEFAQNGAETSKVGMVRAAVADGMESPGDGVAWTKAHHGVEMPGQMWSCYRSQARARETRAAGGEHTPRARNTAPARATGIPVRVQLGREGIAGVD